MNRIVEDSAMKKGALKNSIAVVVTLAALFLTACGPAPFPADKESYIGSWSSSDGTYFLYIGEDALVEQQQYTAGGQSSLSGAISEWKGDNFVVFFHEFIVEDTPHDVDVSDESAEGGTFVETHMTVDGFDLVKSN